MNRIRDSIMKMRAQIQLRIDVGLTTAAQVEETRKSLDMGLDEFARFQELKSLASMGGTLTLDEAQYVYSLLGETPNHFNNQNVEVKAVLTKLFAELLARSIAHA